MFRDKFIADSVRCWKALPAVYVEHHRFPHAERQEVWHDIDWGISISQIFNL